jgi:hypothetical protein
METSKEGSKMNTNPVVKRAAIAGMFLLLPLLLNAQSVWKDPATGLTWADRSSEKQVSQEEAVKYCENLKTGGYSWRLPSIDELAGIYDSTQHSECGAGQPGPATTCHIKGGIKLSGPFAWSSTLYPVHPRWAWFFNFLVEGKRQYAPILNWTGFRALCVVK